MTDFFFIKVKLCPHWGFAFRKTIFSKTRDSFLLPPPTTAIGALAYGLTRISKVPEEISSKGKESISSADKLRELVHSVNIKVNTPLHHYSDLGRIWWYRERESRAKFDAVALGKVYALSKKSVISSLEIVYMFNEDALKRSEFKKEELIAAAYSIARLGSKESITNVINVNYGKALELKEREVRTPYSFWLDLVKVSEGQIIIQNVVDFKRSCIGDYSKANLRLHAYPYNVMLKRLSVAKVKLNSNAKALRINNEVVVIEH